MPHPFPPRASLDRSRATRRLSAGPVAMDAPLLAPQPPARGWFRRAKDEEIDDASAACCRICLEHGAGDELISPCMCKGTQQFVHRSCLDHWRAVREGTAFSHCTTCKARFHLQVQFLEGDGGRKMKFRLFVARDIFFMFLAIQTVIAAIGGVAYWLDKDAHFRNKFANGWGHILSKHPVLFYYCVGVVVFFALIGVLGLILHCLTCSSSNYSSSNNSSSYNDFPRWPESSNRGSDSSDDDSFAIVIIVIIFAILGIVYALVGARIFQRHFHILAKKELTKEYAVVDLRGCYTPPKMDPELELRLKKLQLM